MQAYIAGPLFNDAEKAFNLKVDALVQSLGIQTYWTIIVTVTCALPPPLLEVKFKVVG